MFHNAMILWLVAVAAVVVTVVYTLFRVRSRHRETVSVKARQDFRRKREWLEARFLTLASATGRPRGLAWVDCDFADDVSFARDRSSGHLRALVGVTIRFGATEGGGMEEVEAVSDLRAATAVFRFDKGHWETDGRAVFNLNPDETIRHFQHELEAMAD